MTRKRSRLQKVQRAAGFVVLAATLVFLLPGQSAAVACSLFPPGVVLTLSVTYTPGPPPTWTVTADPCAVTGFQLDLTFDASLTLMSAGDLLPYTGPPPTLVSPGDLQFMGSGPPTVGDVNIFQAVFQGKTQPAGSIFTVSGTGSDYVDILNTSTGEAITVGPAGIVQISAAAGPEPSSLVLFSSALSGLVGVLRKRRT
jgi:hypothetical protein